MTDEHKVRMPDTKTVCKCHGYTLLEIDLLDALCEVMKKHGGREPNGMYRCDCAACEKGRAAIKTADEDAQVFSKSIEPYA